MGLKLHEAATYTPVCRQLTLIFSTPASEISFSSNCREARCGSCATARTIASAPRPRIWFPHRSSSRSPDSPC